MSSKAIYPKEAAPPMAAAGLLGPDLVELYLSWIFEDSRADGAEELLVHRRLGEPRHVVAHCGGRGITDKSLTHFLS